MSPHGNKIVPEALIDGQKRKNMNFGQAIANMFQNYANFKGRSRRSAYWYAYLYYVIGALITMFMGSTVDPYTGAVSYGPAYYIWGLVHFIPVLAAGVRRLHDVDRSGWYILIPIYNIVLMATETLPGTNAYGEPAK